MNYPKVSVLIPTYNRAEFLSLCIESALAQDYPNLEVIVSDNASDDNTGEMMQKKYGADSRVRYYRNETNLGVFPNWERLLYEYATGEYGKLLCDDDYLSDRQHLKKAVDLMQRNTLDIVLSGSILEKAEAGRVTHLVYDPEIPEVTDTQWWLQNGGKKWGQHYLFLNFSSGAVFSLQKAKELKIFTPYVYGGDYEALFRFMLTGRIGYIEGHSFTGRFHGSNDGSLGSFSRAAEGLEIFERIYTFAQNLGVKGTPLDTFIWRNRIVFINTFLVPKWLREKGVSFHSLRDFRRYLTRIDKTLFPKVIMTYPTLCWMLRLKNEKVYNAVRNVLRILKNLGKRIQHEDSHSAS